MPPLWTSVFYICKRGQGPAGLVPGWGRAGTHPAEGQQEVQPGRVGYGVAQLPVDQVLPGEDQQGQPHGHKQHIEDACHVVNVQLAAHHLVLLILADPREPHRLQLLGLPWGRGWVHIWLREDPSSAHLCLE